jgi:hypothetical protein
MAMDEGGRCVIRTREGRLSLPELAMPAASGGGDGQVADIAADGGISDGNGCPRWRWWLFEGVIAAPCG